MTTLIEFLTARVEEDRALAQGAIDDVNGEDCWFDTGNAHIADHYQRHSPDRVLREVAAKRAIIELAYDATGLDMSVDNDRLVGSRDQVEDPYIGDLILRQLAQAYSDHSDFNAEWSTT